MYSNGGFEADIFDGNFNSSKPTMHTTQIDGFHDFDYDNKRVKEEEEIADADDESAKKKNAMKKCMKSFASMMISHLGIFLIVLAYVLMGGFLFTYLEFDNEKSSCTIKYTKYVDKLNEAVDRIYNVAQSSNSTTAKRGILTEMSDFAEAVNTLGVDPTLDCATIGEGDNMANWNTVNAAYFCVTIVTTIGYGHISPVTQWGQIVCMIYSLLGIPLMLLFLSKIGEPTAMVFRSFYLNIFCCKCFVKRLPNECKIMEAMKKQQTSWQEVEEGNVTKQPPAKVADMEIVEEEYDEEENLEDEVVNIPITVTIMLLLLYILIGAAVFGIWEKEWSVVEGTYFSFITLSTIGFGDYVPGRDGPFDDPAVITELLVGCVYCLFGLAMLSMCINLIQDEITAKFSWLGRKIGCIKDPEPEEEDDDDDDDDDEDDSSDEESSEEEGNKTARTSTAKSAKTVKTEKSTKSTKFAKSEAESSA